MAGIGCGFSNPFNSKQQGTFLYALLAAMQGLSVGSAANTLHPLLPIGIYAASSPVHPI